MHRDFDLDAEAHEGRIDVFPAISTITYLSSATATMPTLILTDFTRGESVKESVLRRLVAVFPSSGKHVSFDGHLWHGVAPPLVFSPAVARGQLIGRVDERRVTLLVNIWINRSSVMPMRGFHGLAKGVHGVAKGAANESMAAQAEAGPSLSVPDVEWTLVASRASRGMRATSLFQYVVVLAAANK